MILDSQKFYKELEKGIPSSVIFLYGDEPYLVQQAFERVKWCAQIRPDDDFNVDIFYAGDCDISRVVEAVETLPVMVPQRFVVLKEAQDLKENEWAQLEPVLLSPVPSTLLVILASRVDKRRKAQRILLEKAVSVEFKKPYDNQIPRWIHYIAQNLKMQITDRAILMLHRLVGNQLFEIESELCKLRDYAGERRIDEEDILKVVSRGKEESVFEFTKAVGEGNRIDAFKSLNQLMTQGESEMGLLALMARHIRILLSVQDGLNSGLSGMKLAHYAQVPPFFIDNYVRQTESWTQERLEKALALLAQTDRHLKSSYLDKNIWLENLVFKLLLASSPY